MTPLPAFSFRLVSIAVCSALGGAVPLLAEAQAATAVPVPHNAYPGDRIGVPLYGEHCGVNELDTSYSPQVRRTAHFANDPSRSDDDVYRYEVDYHVRNDPNALCGVPPPPGYVGFADVGPLPEGIHTFSVRGFKENTQVFTYTTAMAWVRVHSQPGNDISGAWYAPSQSGRGVFVLSMDVEYGKTAVYWATHDGQGQPTWVMMLPVTYGNLLEGEAFTTTGAPLGPQPATLTQQRWGALKFHYVGCGRARLEWNADDPQIQDGAIDLVQLALPQGAQACDIARFGNVLPATWAP